MQASVQTLTFIIVYWHHPIGCTIIFIAPVSTKHWWMDFLWKCLVEVSQAPNGRRRCRYLTVMILLLLLGLVLLMIVFTVAIYLASHTVRHFAFLSASSHKKLQASWKVASGLLTTKWRGSSFKWLPSKKFIAGFSPWREIDDNSVQSLNLTSSLNQQHLSAIRWSRPPWWRACEPRSLSRNTTRRVVLPGGGYSEY